MNTFKINVQISTFKSASNMLEKNKSKIRLFFTIR